MKTKNNLFIAILLLGISFIVLQSSSILAATAPTISTYCAQHTIYGAWCQDVPLNQVDTTYQYSQTSCQSTTYCATGTCVNVQTGTCLPSPQATCDPAKGGTWYSSTPSNTPICKIGCCLIGDQASFTTKAACSSFSTLYGINSTFDASINNELDCITSAQPQVKGACVYDTGNGRTCEFTTRQTCKGIASSTFHQDFLCTNPTLGTNCAMTTQTTCIKTADQVYFMDSCGNQANVYDANKVKDVNYWSYVAGTNGVTLNTGSGANIESTTNGDCNYLSGSTCMPYSSTIDGTNIPAYGNNICRNVNCISTSDPYVSLFNQQYGRTPLNGESWCGLESSTSIQLEPNGHPPVTATDIANYDKTGNNPGDTDVLFICANGKVTPQIGAPYRAQVCVQNSTILNTGVKFYSAEFVQNNWLLCFAQNSSKNCLNTANGDCQWTTGASVLKDSSGAPEVWDQNQDLLVPSSGSGDTRGQAACVPKYPSGFDTSAQNTCGTVNQICLVNYTQSTLESISHQWYISGPVTCLQSPYSDDNGGQPSIVPTYQTDISNLCRSMGDCGISINYIGTNGGNGVSDIMSVVTGNNTGETFGGFF
jgi:hypothetical protein